MRYLKEKQKFRLGSEIHRHSRGNKIAVILSVSAAFLSLLFFSGIRQAGAQECGCIACHTDAHSSCASCHPNKFPMNHPSGAGTPITGDLSSAEGINTACGICHVQANTTHPFRINLDIKSPTTYPDVDPVCGQCHAGSGAPTPGIVQFTPGWLSVYATNIHNKIPRTASFTWSIDGGVSNKVNFDASASACANPPCTYSWNFGDGTIAAAGAVTSYTYPKSGSYITVVKVTGSTGGVTISPIHQITAANMNTAPVAAKLAPVISGMTVTISDRSTDAEDPPGAMTVTVLCGNSTTVIGPDNSDLVCEYTTAGTYTIRHSVKDTGGLGSSSANVSVTVGSTSKYTVSGTITRQDGSPISGATLYLQIGTQAKYVATSATNGTFTFTNVLAGTYTIRAVKTGLTFTNPAESVPAEIVVGTENVTGVIVKSIQ
jgi:PKD repeat protein